MCLLVEFYLNTKSMDLNLLHTTAKSRLVLPTIMLFMSKNSWPSLLQSRSGEPTLMASAHGLWMTMLYSLHFIPSLTSPPTKSIGYSFWGLLALSLNKGPGGYFCSWLFELPKQQYDWTWLVKMCCTCLTRGFHPFGPLPTCFGSQCHLPFLWGGQHPVLCRVHKGSDQLVLTSGGGFCDTILRELHDTAIGGYLDSAKAIAALQICVWWLHMRADLEAFVAACPTCQRIKDRTIAKPGLLQPLPPPCRGSYATPWTLFSGYHCVKG